ncbi:hypothetical protein FQA47_008737 [Oryzias melastigma]|uniref:Uncharacterized protein n=1 Tax=Oryzias melastigma TaxID=30732 RepID=A0A834CNJ9_ORYME|nr:hypothetical protein FQA47_008737 [Oryzias melastigma]
MTEVDRRASASYIKEDLQQESRTHRSSPLQPLPHLSAGPARAQLTITHGNKKVHFTLGIIRG